MQNDTKTAFMVIVSAFSFVIVFSIVSIIYALIFVTQPMQQAPNDKDFITIISTVISYSVGTLTGIVTSMGFKSIKTPIDGERGTKNGRQ